MLSTILNNKNTYLGCVGANALLFGGMAFRMSLYRIASMKANKGNPDCIGEDGENFYVEQQLCSEYAPVGSALALALYVKYGSNQGNSTASKVAVVSTLLWTVTRYIFHMRACCLPKKLVPPFMITNYLTLFVSCGLLICDQ